MRVQLLVGFFVVSLIIFFSLGPAMPTMIQSPPQITSPSLPQSQFNFPPPAMAQTVNQVRAVSQPPAVIQQQPSAPVLYAVRNPVNEMQPTQIMSKYHEFARRNLLSMFDNIGFMIMRCFLT